MCCSNLCPKWIAIIADKLAQPDGTLANRLTKTKLGSVGATACAITAGAKHSLATLIRNTSDRGDTLRKRGVTRSHVSRDSVDESELTAYVRYRTKLFVKLLSTH